jgi:glycosyltransferase involved in cell wall biosynthesis
MVGKELPVNTVGSTRIGFILPAGQWLGGRNYLRNLFAAIRCLPDNPMTPVIFTGHSVPDASSDFSEFEIVEASILDRKSPPWFVRKVIGAAASEDILLQRLLLRHNVSVLSHSFHLGRASSVKTIGWIPDFQHIHLPEFFTKEERSRRDREFGSICAFCDKVILSSECARADFVSFAPQHAHKAELLHFVATPVPFREASSLPELRRLYDFDGRFFLLPNQFWAHKNHRIVLSALQKLKRQNRPFLVIATGTTEDYRNPSFFPSLMQYASECDVLDCFRVLGKIPFNHLSGFMRHATAFINPSRFEGWSTSVEEAKSLGKQIVLSDIPVHREQEPERSFFFPPDDSDALVAALVAAESAFNSRQDFAIQDEAKARFPERQREFGETYRRIVSLTDVSV